MGVTEGNSVSYYITKGSSVLTINFSLLGFYTGHLNASCKPAIPLPAFVRKTRRRKIMSDSKSGSKTDLNESNMPLLDDVEKTGETPEKEQIELKEGEEKKDDSSEKKNKKKK